MFTLVLWCSPFSYCASTHLFVISFLISRSYYYIIIYYWKYNFPKNTIMSVCWLAGWSFGYSFLKCRDDTLSTLILRTYDMIVGACFVEFRKLHRQNSWNICMAHIPRLCARVFGGVKARRRRSRMGHTYDCIRHWWLTIIFGLMKNLVYFFN